MKRTFAPTNSTVAFWSPESQAPDSNRDSHATAAPLVYVVDDMPCLTELYVLILNASGYVVKGFHDRRAALASLSAAKEKPTLLITDLDNPTMRIEPFLKECVAMHPSLRILMATGFGYYHAWCFSVRPDHFLQKPFTPEELRRAVEATLAGDIVESLR